MARLSHPNLASRVHPCCGPLRAFHCDRYQRKRRENPRRLEGTSRKNWTNKGLISATITGKLYRIANVVRLKPSNLNGLVVRPLTETEMSNWYSIEVFAILR